MMNDPIAALERSLAVLSNAAASAATLKLSAEEARGVVRALDTENERAPQREAQILAGMASPGGPSMDYVLKALASLDDEFVTRALRRKIAVGLATQLDARAHEVEQAEAARDEARRPLAGQARRAQDLAKRIADYPALAARVCSLFRSDFAISKLGANAYSHTPRPQGSHVAMVRTSHVDRAFVTEEVLKSTRLPGAWPPRYSDYSLLERNFYEHPEDEVIVAPIRSLCHAGATEDAVGVAIERAQNLLVSEFSKAVAAIADLLRLDAGVTAADRALRYPDGAPVFDPRAFPETWRIGIMSRFVSLPSVGPTALAAE